MVASTKRGRAGLSDAQDGSGHDPRIEDPYCIKLRPCRLSDHQQQRKKSKTATAPTMSMIKNCEVNPNCLFGLGEHQKGIWQSKKLVQRLLGDDPRDLQRSPNPSMRTNSRALLTPCGLRNLGATCYLNSMLQCLFVQRRFRKAVFDWEPKEAGVDEQQVLQMRALQRLFAAMQLGKKNVYDPQEFASTLSLNSVMQQDAQEFSKLLLAHLRGIFTHSRVNQHTDLVDRLFQGQMNYVTKCLRCNNKSSRPSSYYEISLNIKGHKSVERCIESYLAPELLDGDNKYHCDHCNAKQSAERFIEVEANKLPPILMLQLMRFVYDAQAGRKKKLMDVVEVGRTLNMTEILRRSGSADAFDAGEDAVYRLSGYLNHRGKSAHAGHYTASIACNDTSSAEWFEFDDSVVKNMEAVVDTEGAVEHEGRVIRSRDAYMLIYTRVNDPLLETPVVEPSDLCRDEIAVWNSDFETEVREYEKAASGLEARIEERKQAYKTFFENDTPCAEPGSTQGYWVDSEWLKSWVSGEEISASQPKIPNGHATSDKKPEKQQSSPTEESKDDETESEDGNDDAVQDHPKPMQDPAQSASGSADGVPFAEPMDISRFCCEHSTRSGPSMSLHLSPDQSGQLKRVSAPLFDYLRQTCGVAFDGIKFPPGAKLPLLDGSKYRCPECEASFRAKLLQDADHLSEVAAEMELLKAPVMPGEPLQHLMSKAWLSSYKTYLKQNHKSLQRASQAALKRPKANNHVKQQFLTEADVVASTMWQSPLNEDITCSHGNLIMDKKKYKPVSLDTWLHFSKKYPTDHTYEATEEPCYICVADQASNDQDSERERAVRNSILDRTPISRLYRRKLQRQSGSFMLNEVFVPLHGASSSSSRKVCMFLVDASWMSAWRAYVRDVDRPEPAQLSCDGLTCDHGKLLLPRSMVQVLKGESMAHSDMEVEFVYPDEMMHLGELYSRPESRFYFGEWHPSGQMTWKTCTLRELGDAVATGACIPSSTADGLFAQGVVCHVCEDATEREFQDGLHNFIDRVVHVQLLAEDQPVPTSETLADDGGSGRRRSRRIKTGSGAAWPIIASAHDSVYILKSKVFAETDEFPIRQRLYFRGEVLQDHRTLKECGIKAGDAVYMRLAQDIQEELAIADDGNEREVGFEDSVFVTRRPPPPAPTQPAPVPVWVCSVCTFLNEAADDACEMCSSQRAIEIE